MNQRRSTNRDDQAVLAARKWNEGRWGVGVVAALFVSSAVILPGDAAGSGIGLVLHVFALVALTLWALWTCTAPRAFWRVSWLDALVAALLVWIGVSAWIMAGQGNPRLTINLFWIWAVLVASYWLARQFLRTAEDCRAVVALMLAVAVVEASLGLYQATIVRPRDRALFEADQDAALRAAGIVAPEGSPLRAQFASRMRDTEPLGTFSLTNSLAGLLAPWWTLAIGIGLAMFQARRTAARPDRDGVPATRLHWAMVATAFVLVAICLLLTKSRSAYLATLGGLGLISVIAVRRRWKFPTWWWLAGAAGLAILVALATAFGLLDREVLTEARMSLGVRWEYWQSTWGMTLDHPWWGCGVGNFQNYYAGYKLPQASEMVADPHNWLFELAANAGWPAATLLATFLTVVVTQLVIPPLLGREPAAAATDESVSTARTWGYGGFGLGLVLAVVASLLSQFVPESFLLFVAMPIGVAMVWSFRPWVRHGTLPAWAVGVSLVVLLVNLSAAGSLAFGGVSGTLWLLAACGLRLHEIESAPSVASSEPPRTMPRWGSAAGLVLAVVLLIGCIVTTYRPVMLGSLDLQRGDTLARLGETSLAEAAYQSAAERDPWSYESWQRLAGLHAQSVLRTPRNEQAWRDLDQAAAHAIGLNRQSYVLRRELADLHLSLWRQSGDSRALERAAEFLEAAVGLSPNSNILHAQLAWVFHLRGMSAESRREAEEALRLDEVNHHREQKLGQQRITDGRSRIAGQPLPPERESAEQVARRLAGRAEEP